MYDWAEFRHFRYLLTILELQGFRSAADELNTAQPNLSVHAKQFQANASIRLYKKTKSGRIRVTETGLAFKALARFLLETRDEVIDALIAIERGEISSVRFGCAAFANHAIFQDFCTLHKELLPACPILPTRGDTAQLAREVLDGTLDAAIVTLPLQHPDLRIEELRSDRLVVCLRRDNPLAMKAALLPTELQNNLAVLYHPERDPAAHRRLLEMLSEVGVSIGNYSRASHPSEMQALVKDGYGFALIREGSPLDQDLTTRPIAGVEWTVDTVAVYHKERYPKTVPILLKRLLKQPPQNGKEAALNKALISVQRSIVTGKRPPQREKTEEIRLKLTG